MSAATLYVVRYTLTKNGVVVHTLRGSGPGVAAGGTDGQVLVKSGTANYATAWASQSAIAAGTAATLATPRNIDGQAFNGSADITVVAPATHAATSKATPVDADELPLSDSAAAWVLKKLTWANLKATLFASPTITGTVTGPVAIAGPGVALSADSSNGNANILALKSSNTVRSYLGASATNLLTLADAAAATFYSFTSSLLTIPGQIKFPATQVPSADANTLDDYEEGTFTPVLRFGGASTGVTYTTQSGSYTKVGNKVSFCINVRLTNKGSSTGAATIGGLPFPAAGSAGFNYAGSVFALDLTGMSGGLMAYTGAGATSYALAYTGTGNGSNMTDANFQNNSWVVITGTYFV
jgi:hypothetical protein